MTAMAIVVDTIHIEVEWMWMGLVVVFFHFIVTRSRRLIECIDDVHSSFGWNALLRFFNLNPFRLVERSGILWISLIGWIAIGIDE